MRTLTTIMAVIAVAGGGVCRAEGSESAFALASARHSLALPDNPVHLTIRVSRDGRIDINRASFNAVLKQRKIPVVMDGPTQNLSLSELKNQLAEGTMINSVVARRLGRDAWIKLPSGSRISTLELRLEFDRSLDLGRVAWILTAVNQHRCGIGWLVVNSPGHDKPRGVRADYSRALARMSLSEPSKNPVLAPVALVGGKVSSRKEGTQPLTYRFGAKRYARVDALARALSGASKHVRKKHGLDLAVAPMMSTELTVQQFVEFRDALATSGVLELLLTPSVIPDKATTRAKPLPSPKPYVLTTNLQLNFESIDEPIRGLDAKLLDGSSKGVRAALQKFERKLPPQLEGWKSE